MRERLQKIVARAGLASRRAAEDLVTAGRVRVNGKVVDEIGSQADPFADRIEVDGRLILAEDPVYLVLHKPREVVSTMSDPEGRPTVADLLHHAPGRIYPVGRLDFATSGVLLATNDGEFANGLLHPRQGVPKTYVLKVRGRMEREDIERWENGVELEDGKTLPAHVRLVRYEEDRTWIEVTLQEGRNQQIRRMGDATGFFVMRLARTSFAGITSDGLRPGQWRNLSRDELMALRETYGVPKRIRGVGTSGEIKGRVLQRGEERGPARGERRPNPRGDRPRDDRPAQEETRRDDPRAAPRSDWRPSAPRDDRRPAPRGDRPPPRDDRRPGTGRDDRPPPRFDRDRPAPRGDRPAPRDDRRPGTGRDDRPPPRFDRDRPAPRGDRPGPRDDRRPGTGRDDRPPPRFDRDRPADRPTGAPRDDRPAPDRRPAHAGEDAPAARPKRRIVQTSQPAPPTPAKRPPRRAR